MIDERRRHDLYTRVAETFGEQEADTLMAHLPPVGWADVATTSEVRTLGVELRAEMAELGAQLQIEMSELRSELRGEMSELRSELRGEMAELRSELRGEMAELRGEMSELRDSIQRTVIAASIASSFSTATLVLAAAALV